MDRVIELLKMPAMQMSILDRMELGLHIAIITILCFVAIAGVRKMFK